MRPGSGNHCRIKMAAARRRYNKTEKGKAARKRHSQSEKGKATRKRYDDSRIRVHVAGVSMSYRVPPERRDELVRQLADFRAQQRKNGHSVE